MPDRHPLDAMVRTQLRKWPQRPPGAPTTGRQASAWLRGRPAESRSGCHPFLKMPGQKQMKTLPDGLWLHFGGTPEEPYCEVFAIEACSTVANLLDKRSRFAPSTQSLLAVCPVPWLLMPVSADDPTPRWKATGVLRAPPVMPLVLPVRDVRVMYGLKIRQYCDFARSAVPHPHEYFVPMAFLTADGGDRDPAMRALVARASSTANFIVAP